MPATPLFPPLPPCCPACACAREAEALRAMLRHCGTLTPGSVQGELRAWLRAELAAACDNVEVR